MSTTQEQYIQHQTKILRVVADRHLPLREVRQVTRAADIMSDDWGRWVEVLEEYENVKSLVLEFLSMNPDSLYGKIVDYVRVRSSAENLERYMEIILDSAQVEHEDNSSRVSRGFTRVYRLSEKGWIQLSGIE